MTCRQRSSTASDDRFDLRERGRAVWISPKRARYSGIIQIASPLSRAYPPGREKWHLFQSRGQRFNSSVVPRPLLTSRDKFSRTEARRARFDGDVYRIQEESERAEDTRKTLVC